MISGTHFPSRSRAQTNIHTEKSSLENHSLDEITVVGCLHRRIDLNERLSLFSIEQDVKIVVRENLEVQKSAQIFSLFANLTLECADM